MVAENPCRRSAVDYATGLLMDMRNVRRKNTEKGCIAFPFFSGKDRIKYRLVFFRSYFALMGTSQYLTGLISLTPVHATGFNGWRLEVVLGDTFVATTPFIVARPQGIIVLVNFTYHKGIRHRSQAPTWQIVGSGLTRARCGN